MAFSFPWFINGNRVSMATRRSCIVFAASICTFIITCIICIFGSPTISANDSMRMITSWICSSIMPMCRKFSDRGLDYTTPHKYSNVWWQVIMWLIVTCLRDRNSVRMVSCTIGNSIMCNATVSSTGVNSTAVTAHVHWQTVLMTTCSIDARYVAVRRQFPDSFMPSASTYKLQARAACYCELFRCQYRQ